MKFHTNQLGYISIRLYPYGSDTEETERFKEYYARCMKLRPEQRPRSMADSLARWRKKHKQIALNTKSMAEAERLVKECNVEDLEFAHRKQILTATLFTTLAANGNKLVSSAIAERVDWLRENRESPQTADSNESELKSWAKAMKCYNTPVTSITTSHVDGFVNAPGKNRLSTRKKQLGAIRAFLKFCVNKGYCSVNPAAVVTIKQHLLSFQQKESKKRTYLDDAKYEQLIVHLRKRVAKLHRKKSEMHRNEYRNARFWLAACQIGRETGLREGDIATLQLASIVDDNLVVFTDKKNVRVELKISEELKGVIKSFVTGDIDQKWVFPDHAEKYRRRPQLIYIQANNLFKGSGLTGHSFHDLRRARATDLSQTQPLQMVAKQLGHSSVETTKLYVLPRPQEPVVEMENGS